MVDDIFCISFGFKGNWSCHLTCQGPDGELTIPPDGGAIERGQDEDGEETFKGQFSGLQVLSGEGEAAEQMIYELLVEEDPELAQAEEDMLAEKAANAPEEGDEEAISTSMGEDSSTCSCLFGNPCQSAYSCNNWPNRFEIAKQNGWKGHS